MSAALVTAACLGGGGNESAGGGGNVCARAESKLEGCNLIESGSKLACEEPDGEGERCQANCLLNASCDDLRALFCGLVVAQDLDLLDCYDACPAGNENEEQFTCGDGSSVPADWQCDGEEDCDDGSDEAGCVNFSCADGSDELPAEWECDGFEDCSDGSDEAACPELQGEGLETLLMCD